MGLQIKEVLRNLCRSNGWLYAVVWQAKCRDSILLCSGDAYYDDQISMLANKMLQQVHLVGEGLIGRVACSGGHQWIFSDTYFEVSNDKVPVGTQAAFQDTAELWQQFVAGIQTIAVISVSSQSAVQFGSSQKISERSEFINHVKSLFQPLQSISGPLLSANAWKMLNYDAIGLNWNLASLELSDNYYNHSNFKQMHDNGCKEMLEKVQDRSGLARPYNSSVPGVDRDVSRPHLVAASDMAGSVSLTKGSNELLQTRTAFMNNSSHSINQIQSAGGEAQVKFSSSNKPLTDVMQSNSSSANSLVLNYSTTNMCRSSISTSTSMEQQLLTGMGNQGPSNILLSSENTTVPYGNTFHNFQQSPSPLPLSNANGSVGRMDKAILNPGVLEPVHGWISSPLFHAVEGRMPSVSPCVPQLCSKQTSLGKHRTTDIISAISNPKPRDCLNLQTVPLLEPVQDDTAQKLNGSMLHPVPGAPFSSETRGGDVLSGIPVGNLLGSVQNSTFCGTNTIDAVHDGKKFSCRPARLTANNDLFDCLGVNLGQSNEQGFWNDYLPPEHCGNHSDLSTNVSECITELNAGSMDGPGKGSDHGLEQLLDAIVGSAGSIKKHNSDDPASVTTITKAGSTSMYSNHLPVSGLFCLNENSSLLCKNKSGKIPPGCNKEASSTSVISSWIDSSHNINAESVAVSQPKRPDEPPKLTRKRARPGESSRPRPKDRQQIQDRVKELREIVPNGAKCSIDNLLERTIKHMLFLQSVTKYAKKLKEVDEPKMIGEEAGVVLKDSSGSSSGATWAFEVGGQTMFCPIVVEDLNPPGQMLVEMLCEERGFFLEIADVIRGFGLTILKGVMEVRDSKIWARFVVEANRDVTRMDIFLSLVQLLQHTTNGTVPGDQLTAAAAGVVPSLVNYQQTTMPLPISTADMLL